MKRLRRFRSAEEGATAVEFGFVAVPFLLVVLGCIEFGRLMWTRAALQQTAIATARCMGVKQSSCAPSGTYSSSQTLSFLQTTARGWSVTIPSTGVTLNNDTTCSGVDGFSQVSVSYQFTTAAPLFLGSLASVPLQISACFPNRA